MKILYVITGLGQGGAERVVCDLADSMYEQGCEVKIAYLTGNILTRPCHEEIEIIKLDLNNLISLFRVYLHLSNLIKTYNPDVIHSHMVHANLLMRFIRIFVPIKKLISTAHNSNEGGGGRIFLYRLTHKLADITTNVSNTATISFEKNKAVPKNGMLTIYNGVNLKKFKYHSSARKEINLELGLNPEIKIILAVGRFNKQKNYPNLLKAVKIVKEKFNFPFLLLIAGDGELRSNIEELIGDLELNDSVILLGRRSDIPNLMSACDVFVLSSDYEGLPTVLIEAIACEAHVVSTDVSGAREIIYKYGKIVPINDSLALANNIFTTLEFSNKNKEGAEYIQSKFDLDIISGKWLEIYLNESF